MWTQLVQPNVSVTDSAGMCLRFTQSVWGAPVKYASAWDAWQATTLKHSVAENIPDNVAVVVWFSHWGSYGQPLRYDNWGHVVSWVPGRGYLSSPGRGVGQQWFATIGEVERFFNAGYVGWSEDINGLQVASFSDVPDGDEMTPEQANMLSDIYSAIFKKDKLNSFNLPGGLLKMAEIEASQLSDIYAAIFKKEQLQTFDLPGGLLKVAEIEYNRTFDYDLLADKLIDRLPKGVVSKEDIIEALTLGAKK
jgi:hypothetical protein